MWFVLGKENRETQRFAGGGWECEMELHPATTNWPSTHFLTLLNPNPGHGSWWHMCQHPEGHRSPAAMSSMSTGRRYKFQVDLLPGMGNSGRQSTFWRNKSWHVLDNLGCIYLLWHNKVLETFVYYTHSLSFISLLLLKLYSEPTMENKQPIVLLCAIKI